MATIIIIIIIIIMVDNEQSYRWLKSETLREKQKVKWWQLKTKHLVQTILRIKF